MAVQEISASAEEGNPPFVDYLAYDGQRMTFDKLTHNLNLSEQFLYNGELQADAQGHDDLAEVFADARDCIMDMMPGKPPVRRPVTASGGEGVNHG